MIDAGRHVLPRCWTLSWVAPGKSCEGQEMGCGPERGVGEAGEPSAVQNPNFGLVISSSLSLLLTPSNLHTPLQLSLIFTLAMAPPSKRHKPWETPSSPPKPTLPSFPPRPVLTTPVRPVPSQAQPQPLLRKSGPTWPLASKNELLPRKKAKLGNGVSERPSSASPRLKSGARRAGGGGLLASSTPIASGSGSVAGPPSLQAQGSSSPAGGSRKTTVLVVDTDD